MPSNYLILCRSLVLPSTIFPRIKVFSNKSAVCIRWPKYWSFNFSNSPSNEYSKLISFRIDWFDILCCTRDSQRSSPAPQFEGINSLAASLLDSSTLTTICEYWRNHSLNYMDLCQQSDIFVFNTLSRFIIAFLARSNCLLISWLQSPSTMILEPKKIKSVTVSTFPP